MDWESAGAAWGWRAADWATLVEHGNMALFLDVLDAVDLDETDTYLDVGCGSGLAIAEAARRGANVAGLDASRNLVDVAQQLVGDGDLRAGDMTELPWPDDSFSVVTSFNGVWNVEEAFAEVRRVLRPNGRFAMSFWGPPDKIDFYRLMPAILEFSPPEELSAAAGLLSVSEPGAAEDILERNGFRPERRSATTCIQRYADLEIASRALIASGPTYAAVQCAGEPAVRARLQELAEDLVNPLTGIVEVCNEWHWLTAVG